MTYNIFLTEDAAQDLEELYDYIASHDSPQKANYVLKKIEECFNSLTKFPERGIYPKELSALGIREYQEIYFKPYRIIYKIIEQNIYIYLIIDGRRDMQSLLEHKLLKANI